MALTKCRECDSEISSSARRCPKCGKVRTTGSSVVWTLIIVEKARARRGGQVKALKIFRVKVA